MQTDEAELNLNEIHLMLDRLCPADELAYITARPWLYETMAQYICEQGKAEGFTIAECRATVISYIQLQQAKRRKRLEATLAILRQGLREI